MDLKRKLPASFSILLLVATGIFFVKPGTAFSQRKYYEYNNPDALKLTKSRIQQLTSGEWLGSKITVDIPGNNYDFRNRHNISYRPDKTYFGEGLSGTWEIKYGRYMVHTAGTRDRGQDHPFVGVYCVTALNDSVLTLVKLHSSSSSTTRTLSFRKGKQSIVEKNPSDLKVKVFQAEEPVNFYLLTARHSVPEDEIQTIDSLAIDFIQRNKTSHPGADEIDSVDPYFRQYIGYRDRNGHNIIYLNAFSDYHSNWTTELVRPTSPISQRSFNLYINLDSRECFGLHVNGN